MAIRDCSNLPDDQVPKWVRRAREARRLRQRLGETLLCSCDEYFPTRNKVLGHCKLTGHKPLVTTPEDKFLVFRDPKTGEVIPRG